MPAVIAEQGFGDSQNSYAWAMEWFKGKLYVGTGRSVMCVEAATSQFYFQFTSFYKTHPAPHVRCPASPYDLNLRAEIWRYSPQTGRWRRVYRSPADVPNPRSRGKFLARDIAYRGMKVMRDRRGRRALFVSGVTANEYVPENARRHPPRLLRTYDGKHFYDISRPLIVHRAGGFQDRRPIGYRGLEVWRNRLYVVASTALTGDGALFRVRGPFGRKPSFSQVTPKDMHVFEIQKFDGDLYLGTGSFDTGFGVYRLRRARSPYRFEPVVTGGAGMGPKMVSVVSMTPFKRHLYVGAVSWYSAALRDLPASELIRVGRDGQWEVVAGAPRPGPDGRLRTPISGLPAGFGNAFNSHLWRMVENDGTLYVGTLDWSWLFQESKAWAGEWSGLIDLLLAGESGFDLWASCDGVDWFALTRTAFGRDPYDFGVRNLTAARGAVFIGTANHAFGTRIWDDDLSPCRRPSGASRLHAAQAPRRVLTDVQRDGTVVSWESTADAVRYRVERAEYVDAPVSVWDSPVAPEGFALEGAQPKLAPPGAPGSVAVDVPVRKPFESLGTTSRAFFVDRTRRPGARYAYQVVAENPGGSVSKPSNVQVVPDPRPPATFAELERAGVRPRAIASLAGGRRRGDEGALARLARLARAARNDRIRQVAYRLERRLSYQHLAGGPVKGG
jgi:hypothetical protein